MNHELSNQQIAWAEYRNERLLLAIRFAEYGLASDDECAPLWEVHGLALRDLGRPLQAADSLEQASLLSPISNEARIALADCYAQLGRRELAKDLFLTAMLSHQLDESELLQVAAGLEAIDQPRLAMEACRRARAKAPDVAQVYYDMGFYASRCGNPPHLTETLIRLAVDLEPRNLHYRIGLASLMIRHGRKVEASETLQNLDARQIAQVTCQCCLKRIANLFFDMNDHDRARLCAERLAELRSTTATVSPQNKVMQ